MRMGLSLLLLLIVMALAACSAGGAGEPTLESAGEQSDGDGVLLLVTPERADGYPSSQTGGGGYPVAPIEAELPTGYLEDTVPVPAEAVDLAEIPETTPGDEPQVMPAPGRPEATLAPGMGRMVAAIVNDLSARTDVPVADIRVLSAEPMTWPNGALGCPAADMFYIEVIIEGMLFTLEADGDSYTYHTDSGTNYVLCRDGQPVSSGSVE